MFRWEAKSLSCLVIMQCKLRYFFTSLKLFVFLALFSVTFLFFVSFTVSSLESRLPLVYYVYLSSTLLCVTAVFNKITFSSCARIPRFKLFALYKLQSFLLFPPTEDNILSIVSLFVSICRKAPRIAMKA